MADALKQFVDTANARADANTFKTGAKVMAEDFDAKVSSLFAAIAHGDEKHRAWLKQAIEDHFAGRPVQRPQ